MKKLPCAILMPMLLGFFAVSAFAAQIGSKEIDVHARFNEVSTTPASYSVDLRWTDMTFIYTKEDTHIWDPKNHTYKTSSRGGWENTRGSITVTNHSNVDVRVQVTYTPVEDTGVTGVLKNSSGKLKAGAVGDYGGADSMTATLVISGKPDAAMTSPETKIGSLKVTIQ